MPRGTWDRQKKAVKSREQSNTHSEMVDLEQVATRKKERSSAMKKVTQAKHLLGSPP